MKDWKENFKKFAFDEGSITREIADTYIAFIEQIISERDKEWQKEKAELEYKLYMKTDKMYQILTQLENCLYILGKIESQKENHLTVEDYLKEDNELSAMWRNYRD